MNEQLDLTTLDRTLAKQVIPGCWEKMLSCTQRGTCTASCTAAHAMALNPRRMWRVNLTSYQNSASRAMGRSLRIPILFHSELVGLAFGLPGSELLFHRHVVPVESVMERLSEGESVAERIEG